MPADKEVIYYWTQLLLIAHSTLALSLCIKKFMSFFLKRHVFAGSELTEFTSWHHHHWFYFIFTFVLCKHWSVQQPYRQENMSPVPVSLHSKMGFLVSTNSFYFLGLIIKNNYKDLYKLCVLSSANTNKMYHYLGFFLNLFSTMQYDPLLSALPSNTLGKETIQLSLIHGTPKHSQWFLNISNGIWNTQTIGLRNSF